MHHAWDRVRAAVVVVAAFATCNAFAVERTPTVLLGGPQHRCDDALRLKDVRPNRPVCTMARALALVPKGGTIEVRGGDYPPLTIKDLRRDPPVTIAGRSGERAAFADVALQDVSGLRLSSLVMGGVDILGASSRIRVERSLIAPGGVKLVGGVHHVTLRRNRLNAPTNNAITFSTRDVPIADVRILDNRFAGVGADAIQLKRFQRVTVAGNHFTGVARHSPTEHSDVLQSYLGGDGLTFERNVLDGNASGVLLNGGHTTRVRIANNVFVRQSDQRPLQIHESTDPVVVNNTFWDTRYGVGIGLEVRGLVLANNIFESLAVVEPAAIAYEDHNLIVGGYRTGKHDLTKPPIFADPGAGEFALRSRSPGLDAGNGDYAPAGDVSGCGRADARKIHDRGAGRPPWTDIGAYEFRGRRPRCGRSKGR